MTVAVCVSLGVWQLRRHAWRQGVLAERVARIELPPVAIAVALADPEAHRDRRAEARGRFLPAESITVREFTPAGEEGVSVWTPLVLEPATSPDAPVVLVDRGFVPTHAAEGFLAQERAADSASVEILGRVLPLALGDVVPASASSPRQLWYRFDPAQPEAVAALQAQLTRRLAPVALESEAAASRRAASRRHHAAREPGLASLLRHLLAGHRRRRRPHLGGPGPPAGPGRGTRRPPR